MQMYSVVKKLQLIKKIKKYGVARYLEFLNLRQSLMKRNCRMLKISFCNGPIAHDLILGMGN